MKFRINWLSSCVSELTNSIPGFGNLNDSEKEKLIIQKFLLSDVKLSSVGMLPENVTTLHLVHLPGPYVLQVNKIDNINCQGYTFRV
ncbi:hypothetical protein MKW98_019674 [Papaver atlanticum]|uniref:Uncharacterized protein n=1 Tax=Papaver atlanticum TaxID=357466 RepID=A0AAD4SBF4_9MAGN|nr:hypothetical protein MKW98_019674 [Papaver atlanticum]